MSKVRILHLSDPHFGTVFPEVRAALLAAAQDLAPDLCLISGDITQRARRAQFKEARAFVEDLAPIEAFAVPGNHDIPLFNLIARVGNPYGGFHGYFQANRERRLTIGGVEVLGLNSTSRWRHVQGNLDIDRVRGVLMQPSPGAVVRIAAIHHPLACAQAVDDKNRLVNRDEVFRAFEQARIDLVLSGHVHDPFVTLSDTRFTSSRPMILSVAGTCLSHRTRKDAPNSFHLVDIQTGPEPELSLVRYDFDPSGKFAERPGAAFAFSRTGERWTRRLA